MRKLLFLLLFIISLSFVNVYADNDNYKIEKVDFDIKVSRFGDADITERWVLSVIGDRIEGFSRKIECPQDFRTAFGGIDIVSIKTGKDYFKDSKNLKYPVTTSQVVNWKQTIKNGYKSDFSVTYKLYNVVKLLDDTENVVFGFRLIDNDIYKNIDDINLKITFPEGSSEYKINGDYKIVKQKNNVVTLKTSKDLEPLILDVELNKNYFTITRESPISNKVSINWTAVLSILGGLITLIGAVVGIVLRIRKIGGIVDSNLFGNQEYSLEDKYLNGNDRDKEDMSKIGESVGDILDIAENIIDIFTG